MENFIATSLCTPTTAVVVCLIAYLGICRALRFRRIKLVERKYGFGTLERPNFSSMTYDEAHEIQQEVAEAEFPSIFEKGLQLALFRTYGIPTISKLLNQTGQLSTTEHVGKRYADTNVVVVELYANPPTDNRAIEAYARLNYLHGSYRKSGLITNDDMLYTLALFMNHPCEWINRYEWRRLTDLEVCAIATFHKGMGEAMRISYDVLPSSKTGWKDGLHFYQELDEWAKDYEKKHMRPHQDNFDTAIKTKELLQSTVPSFTRGVVAQLISAGMDDRLREAVMFEPPSSLTKIMLNGFMSARRFVMRHLALPRAGWQRNHQISKKEGPDGRRWMEIWAITPHYVKPTFWSRWGPTGLYQLMLGAPRPGDEGMCPEGFLRSNLGPKAFNGHGKDEFEAEKQRLYRDRTGACPFMALKS